MPFIPFKQRAEARQKFVAGHGLSEVGELSYIVAEALDQYVGTQHNFARLAAAKGAVQSALDQFDERVVNPYEARKARDNGEVFLLATKLVGGPE